MYDREYFLTTSLSYQLQAARRELADFRSGEIYRKLRADYDAIIREMNLTIKKLQKERDDFSFSRKEITRQWMDVLEDVRKEYEKEVEKLKKTVAALLDCHPANYLESFSSVYLDVLSAPCKLTVKLKAGCSAK